MSPVRQWFFLLGLMLTTPEPKPPKGFGPPQLKRSVELLEAIFSAYARMFWPKPEELPNLTEQWRDVRTVMMPVFLHHFNTGLLASVEQVSDRVRRYLSPFDDSLRDLAGITASDALAITVWVGKSIQKQADDLLKSAQRVTDAKLALLKRAWVGNWNEARIRDEAQKDSLSLREEEHRTGVQDFFKIRLDAMREEFGAGNADPYWNLFVSRRGGSGEFNYLTERNPAEEGPLFEVADGVAFCPLTNAVYNAVLRVGERRLLESPRKEAFLKKRDEVFEGEVEDKLRRFFGDSATFLAGVYETPDLHNEHDLIVLWNRRLFIVEAKASPPTEPFRDPDRAFVRIKRAFQSESGIQKAFDQANRVRRRLAAGETVQLYDSRRNLAATIRPEDVERVYCVCVTRDDFGLIAVDLSLLLEKESGTPYPWAVNIFDLEALLDAWSYFGWGPERLCDYLDGRLKLHGKIFTTDELVVAGYFIKHGGFRHLEGVKADSISLNQEYSDVFDKIYLARQGGEKVVYAPTEPFMGDMRKMMSGVVENELRSGRPGARPGRKQGRNEPCACGSGAKYKRCCGK